MYWICLIEKWKKIKIVKSEYLGGNPAADEQWIPSVAYYNENDKEITKAQFEKILNSYTGSTESKKAVFLHNTERNWQKYLKR